MVIVLAILVVHVIPRVIVSVSDTRTNVNEHNKARINSAVERYTVQTGAQPNSINDLEHPDYFPDGIPANPVDGLPYALDPVTKRVAD